MYYVVLEFGFSVNLYVISPQHHKTAKIKSYYPFRLKNGLIFFRGPTPVFAHGLLSPKIQFVFEKQNELFRQ